MGGSRPEWKEDEEKAASLCCLEVLDEPSVRVVCGSEEAALFKDVEAVELFAVSAPGQDEDKDSIPGVRSLGGNTEGIFWLESLGTR